MKHANDVDPERCGNCGDESKKVGTSLTVQSAI
jgi:hypothetical protein